jgi:hypothetical protein
MSSQGNPWWVIPMDGGCLCVNLADGETVSARILQVSESRIKNYLNDFDRGSDDFRVFHFTLGRNAGIFETIDSFIAKRFNGGSRVFAAFYGKGIQRDLQSQFKAANSGDELLRAGSWHTVPPTYADALFCPVSSVLPAQCFSQPLSA